MLFIIEFVFSLLNSSAALSTWTFSWYEQQCVKVNGWQVAPLISQSRLLQAKCIWIATTLLWPTSANIRKALQNQNCKYSVENIKVHTMQSIMHEKLWLWGSRYFGLLYGNWCCSKHFFFEKDKNGHTKIQIKKKNISFHFETNFKRLAFLLVDDSPWQASSNSQSECFQNSNICKFLGSWRHLIPFQLIIQWLRKYYFTHTLIWK